MSDFREDVLNFLNNIRAEAQLPGTVMIIIGNPRKAAFSPEEVVGKTNEELYALVEQRLLEYAASKQ